MSKTDRHEKTWPQERNFPSIPTGVPVVSTGRAYGADDNCAVVRALVRKNDPEYARQLDKAISRVMQQLEDSIAEAEREIERLRSAVWDD